MRPIDVLPAAPGLAEANVETGSIGRFADVLSNAIQQPVFASLEPRTLTLAWRDNSRAYVDLQLDVTDEMVASLLRDVSGALGVPVTETEVETEVWRLETRP